MNTAVQTVERDATPLPTGWHWMRLGEVCAIIAGQSPPGDTYRDEPSGLPFFQGKADFGSLHPVPRKWCLVPNKVAEPGDILISVRAPVGPTNVADTRCCIGRGLAAIRPRSSMDRDYVLFALRHFENDLAALGSGSTFSAIGRRELESLLLPVPPLLEQNRIAAALREQLDAAARMRAAAERQTRVAEELTVSALREAFAGVSVSGGLQLPLGDLVDFLPARSTASDGDVLVPVVTSGSLSPLAFDPTGVVTNRMWSSDLEVARLRPGEVLVARSNTADLVGQCSIYEGDPPEVYAADLTIRLLVKEGLDPRYLAHFLSHQWSIGYWKERAAGASWTMKKISRRLLKPLMIPVPADGEQRRVVDRLALLADRDRALSMALLKSKASVDVLPAAVLRRALCGGS